MSIISPTQGGKTVNAMTQKTDLFSQPTKPSQEQQLQEMGVAGAKAQY